jgi:branched-subunit amino acid transport protein AzlD
MKTKLTEYPFSLAMIFVAFGLLTTTSLYKGLSSYFELGGVEHLSIVSLAVLVMTISGVALICSLWLKVSASWVLMNISIPLGLIWSINEYITVLRSMEDPEQLAMAVPNILLPAFISGLFCALAFFLTPEEDAFNPAPKEISNLQTIALIIALHVIYATMYLSGFWDTFYFLYVQPFVLFVCCLAMAAAKARIATRLPYKSFNRKSWGKVFIDGGKVAAFLGAAIIALFYIFYSRLDDRQVLGPTITIGFTPVLYGVGAYLVGFLLSLNSTELSMRRSLNLDTWHLIEAYAFVLLATLGPASLFDF